MESGQKNLMQQKSRLSTLGTKRDRGERAGSYAYVSARTAL